MTRRDKRHGICLKQCHEQKRNIGNTDSGFDLYLGMKIHLSGYTIRLNNQEECFAQCYKTINSYIVRIRIYLPF